MATDLGFVFNPDDVPPDGFERLPVGRYLVQCTESEGGPPRSGDGFMVKAVFDVMDGPEQGRKWFENFNLRHPNPDAERIGNQQFERWKKAVGQGGERITNTAPLEFVPFYIDVADRQNKKTGEMMRVIKAFEPYSPITNGQRPQQAARPVQTTSYQQRPQQAAPAQRTQATGGGNRPWTNRQQQPVDDDIPF